MSKIVEDGQRRYQTANAKDLEKALVQHTERIQQHYMNRMTGASFIRRLQLQIMKQRHLARIRQETAGSRNLYLTAS